MLTFSYEVVYFSYMKMKLPENLSYEDVAQAAEESMIGTSNPGFCMNCGEYHDSCEPDMRDGTCESCGKQSVYGAEEILLQLV